MSNFRVVAFPCLEKEDRPSKTFTFDSKEEMTAAANAMADLLLFLQDEVKIMYDYSNSFICEQLIDGEWETVEDD